MASEPDDSLTDRGKLLFGAGFVFGVMATMLLLAVVLTATERIDLDPGSILGSTLMVTLLAGVLFAAIVGSALYILAFPENRTKIPINPEQFGRDREE